MRKKYRRTGFVILSIFILAVICVIAVVIFIYQSGLRYIKSDAGIKFFGDIDSGGNITNGRLWFEYDSASIKQQKFYVVELKDAQSAPDLPTQQLFLNYGDYDYKNGTVDVLAAINTGLPDELKSNYPMNNIVFNSSDDRVVFRSENFDAVIKNYESDKNILSSGEIYTSDGAKWIISSDKSSLSSYKDFEVVQYSNKTNRYSGSIFNFLNQEEIVYASFVLTDGKVIKLYPARFIYRISYDKGNLKGDLYIGKINDVYQKNGRGLYYHAKSGDIYYGDYINDEKTGWSQFISSAGDSYEGYIENGKKNGEGVIKWSDGSSYEGTFKDNMKNGKGKNIFSDGSVYEGDFVDDVKQGFGKYVWAGGDVYEGEFESDLYKGSGKYTWASGDYYEGAFDHNTLHGWGIYTWASGRSYEGWWNLGMMVEDKPDDVADTTG